jgi:hypothetical protein
MFFKILWGGCFPYGHVVGLHKGFVVTIIKVKGDIKKIHDFAVCFNSNFQSI